MPLGALAPYISQLLASIHAAPIISPSLDQLLGEMEQPSSSSTAAGGGGFGPEPQELLAAVLGETRVSASHELDAVSPWERGPWHGGRGR